MPKIKITGKWRDPMPKVTTNLQTWKLYQCEDCGHESKHCTNHFGQFYDHCLKCSWKATTHPIRVHVCLEPLPEGWDTPVDWNLTTLGEVIQ